jgi:HlyD family secretion protein
MRTRRQARPVPSGLTIVLAASLVLAACSGDDGPTVVLGTVTADEVVETVAAPATIQPRDRVTVSAPATGVVAELLVADGDTVAAGDPLVRLTSPTVDQAIAQAEAAVSAADALARVQGGIDLSPLFTLVGDQLDAVLPDLLALLEEQAEALPEDQQEEALAAIDDANERYQETRARLRQAERDAARAAAQATATQREAARAQGRQAEIALDAARQRADDLLVVAPIDGVVELARGGDAPGVPGLDGLSGLGGAGDLGGLLGGGATTSSDGPVSVGSEVAAGQALLTVFDLAAFRVAANVDELDAVTIAVGQRALVLVDAFPDAELPGRVEHVAIEPRTASAGGVSYPITVRLDRVPGDVRLRVGLSGSVEIVTATVRSDTVVSSSALRRRGATDVVYVARDGVIVEVPVRIVAIGDDVAAVDGDLATGERVVIEGIDAVADGDPVPDDAVTR